MRILRACLAVAALAVAGGCVGEGGTVTLTVDQAMGVSPVVNGFSSSNGIAMTSSDGMIHFSATSSQGALTMAVLAPIQAGQMIDLLQDHNYVSFDVTGAGWASNGGMLAVDGVNPYKIRFEAVPMYKGSGSAMGTFVFNGSGTFE